MRVTGAHPALANVRKLSPTPPSAGSATHSAAMELIKQIKTQINTDALDLVTNAPNSAQQDTQTISSSVGSLLQALTNEGQ